MSQEIPQQNNQEEQDKKILGEIPEPVSEYADVEGVGNLSPERRASLREELKRQGRIPEDKN